jgi:hypothetical protein
VEEDEEDEITLFPHGTEISFTFSNDVIGLNPQELLIALREILRSRYSENIFNRVEFDIQIQSSDDKFIRENSKLNFDKTGKQTSLKSENARWHSFQWYLEEMCKGKNPEAIKVVNTVVHQIDGGSWTFTLYYITVPGNKTFTLKKPDFFPVYGRKNQSAQRIHTALEDRFIEPIPIHKILGKEASHNDHNGFIGFIQFKATSEETFSKLPPPATTKVSFYENDPVFRKFTTDLRKDLDVALKTIPKVEAPKPQPKVEAPKPQPKVEVPKPEPKVEVPKPEPKVEVPKPEPKVEVPKPEVKEAPKPEPKVEPKPEPKEAPKPEPKEAPKPQPKVAVEVPKPVAQPHAGSNAAPDYAHPGRGVRGPSAPIRTPNEYHFIDAVRHLSSLFHNKNLAEKLNSPNIIANPEFTPLFNSLEDIIDFIEKNY